MLRSWMITLLALFAGASALAQTWSVHYDEGLTAARAGDWAAAREAFKSAVAFRTEDISGPTLLPGPVTERRRWRNGAPYSPNFLAAYCAYRAGASAAEPAERRRLFQEASAEWEALLSKGQLSYETFYFLNAVYGALGDTEKRLSVENRLTQATGKINWKVDTEVVAPEELARVSQLSGQETTAGTTIPVGTGATGGQPPTTGTPPLTPIGTRVPALANKFALIIGNSQSRLVGGAVPFASDDAQIIRESLVMDAGYLEENIDLVINATADQIRASARALAERITPDATVFLYFAGAGANIEGRDYLAGAEAALSTDAGTMIAKSELFQMFLSKGAKVFAFFQAHRPVTGGRYFGMEVPMFGQVSQMQATMPGEDVFGSVLNGKTQGLFTQAIVSVLREFRSNQVPIEEFGWQVFYRIRRGETGTVGGSSRQTPTLPVLTNLAADARF